MTLAWTDVRGVLADHLEGVQFAGTPGKFTVIAGRCLRLPADGSPFAVFWRGDDADPPEGPMTLGNVMRDQIVMVGLYWHVPPELTTWGAFEDERAEALDAVRVAIRGDLTLGGTATASIIRGKQEGPYSFALDVNPQTGIPMRWYYGIEFELLVRDLEGEAISR